MEADTSSANTVEQGTTPGVEEAVHRLLTGGSLRLSERNRRFLAFVAAETQAGRGDRIKAYTIGVDVFGRGLDFDPGKDPIVRIEATRIRTALAAYYEGPGAHDPVRLVLRPGSYSPVCEAACPPRAPSSATDISSPRDATAPGVPTGEVRTAVVVTHRSDRRDRCAMARDDLYLQAIIKAVSGRGVRVFLTPLPRRKAAARAIKELLSQPDAVFALDVAGHEIAEGCRYSWSLCDLRSGEVKASDAVDRVEDAVPVGARIDAVAAAVAQSVLGALA